MQNLHHTLIEDMMFLWRPNCEDTHVHTYIPGTGPFFLKLTRQRMTEIHSLATSWHTHTQPTRHLPLLRVKENVIHLPQVHTHAHSHSRTPYSHCEVLVALLLISQRWEEGSQPSILHMLNYPQVHGSGTPLTCTIVQMYLSIYPKHHACNMTHVQCICTYMVASQAQKEKVCSATAKDLDCGGHGLID